MAILRMSDDLPPDLEVELHRETSGETVKWAGRASGFVEKFQGWTLVGAGAVFALLNIGGPAAALGDIIDLVERGRAPGAVAFLAAGGGLLFFGAGLAIALFGWRFLKSAERVVWAVTNRRLLRIVASEDEPARSWRKADIRSVDRRSWSDPEKRCLAVTVKGRGRRSDPVLLIIGPVDLEAAESALAELDE